jgi:DegV family protein with EDD domain
MAKVQIVVDSAADLDDDVVESLGIQVVPWTVQLDGETLTDSPALRTPEFYQRAFAPQTMFSVAPPAVRQFSEALERCTRISGQVVAILSSDRITRAVQIARRARGEFMGRCDVQILDSQFISCVQGELAIEAAQAAQAQMEAVEIVRHINALISHSYWAFIVDNVDRLVRHSLVIDTPEVVGAPSGYRPLLLLEQGEIAPLARSRRRGEPIERMVEFVGEFSRLRRVWTVSNGMHTGLESLQTQMNEVLPDQPYRDHIYGPVVASYFGPSVLGVAAMESI